jgi:hypothetical protein
MNQEEMNQEEAEEEKDMKLLTSHAAQLAEHFNTVQLFATRHEDDGTVTVAYGEGNWYARYGQIKLWIKREEVKCVDARNEEEE